ncbi:hypothetical protein EOW77_0034180 [Bradyrhizobium yuanmingense]|uniref:hypothetical protein n=1 Tax=Bradyrhizobium yuanmingense TaxID=108015 RepID=UPI000FE38C0F|nr:hypothetical protein [Bradyrhizobium yuanmingense]TGN74218.1 hypothetical protein EOW77_0034180 [Bradyrhizobium yuanmingense]
MNDRVQPREASRRWSQYPCGEALSKDLAPAQEDIAAEAAGGDYQELDDAPCEWKIGHASSIMTMEHVAKPFRAMGTDFRTACQDNGLIAFVVSTRYDKPTHRVLAWR